MTNSPPRRRIPRGFRWLVWTAAILAIFYFGFDLTGRILWHRFEAKYAKHDVSFDLEDHYQSPDPENDFLQSQTYQQWTKGGAFVSKFTGLPTGVTEYDRSLSWEDLRLEGLGTALDPSNLSLTNTEAAAQLLPLLASQNSIYDQFIEDTKRPEISRDDSVIQLGRVHDWARTQSTRIRIFLHAGDSQRAVDELCAALRFTQHLRERRSLVGMLVQLSILGEIQDVVWEGLQLQAYDSKQLNQFASELDRLTIAENSAEIAVMELARLKHGIVEVEAGNYHAHGVKGGWRTHFWNELNSHVDASRKRDPNWDDYNHTLLLSFQLVAPPGNRRLWLHTAGDYWQHAALGHNGDLPDEFNLEQLDSSKAWKIPDWRLVLFGFSIPNMGRIGEVILTQQQFFDFARIACELEIHFLQDEQYAATLQQLQIEVPNDRWASDRKISFSQSPGGRIQLWSVGDDRRDDGGNSSKDSVWRYNP